MGLFPNAWHVARREYLSRVRTRSFLLVTALIAVVALAVSVSPVLLRVIEGEHATRIGLAAPAGTVSAAELQATLGGGGSSSQEWQVIEEPDAQAARGEVRDGNLDLLLTVSRTADGDLAFSAFTDEGPTDQAVIAVRTAANQLGIADRLQRAGVDSSEVGQVLAPTEFEREAVDPGNSGDFLDSANWFLAYALVILTFMAVITYGTWVAGSVAEEKSSRVMELLITAATPRQLMAGKVLGTGTAGLTQYVVVLGVALVGLAAQGFLAQRLLGEQATDLLTGVDFSVLLPFTAFFIPGFLLYCTLYAGLGSMASRQEDVNQVVGPMLIIAMGGYFASFVAMATPGADWVRALSLIPFFSPYLLSARTVLAGNVAAWEWLVAAALMLLFLAGAIWLAARIYSAGVLMYGQRSNLRSIWRAVRVRR